MNLQKLLDGPTKVRTKIGPVSKLIRLVPGVIDPEFRKVNIEWSPVTVRRTFLYPWKQDQVLESFDIRATLCLKNGKVYEATRLVRLDFDRSVEMMMLEVVKRATLDKAERLAQRLAV